MNLKEEFEILAMLKQHADQMTEAILGISSVIPSFFGKTFLQIPQKRLKNISHRGRQLSIHPQIARNTHPRPHIQTYYKWQNGYVIIYPQLHV